MPIYEYQCERSNVNDLQVGDYGEIVEGKKLWNASVVRRLLLKANKEYFMGRPFVKIATWIFFLRQGYVTRGQFIAPRHL